MNNEMDRAELLTKVLMLSTQVSNGEAYEIDDLFVEKAKSIVNYNGSLSQDEIIASLCALNLLNAAIKTPKFKDKLSYQYIKTNAEGLIKKIDAVRNSEISYYYNSCERCLYYNVGEVIFSFHNVPLTPAVLKASRCLPIKWSGIRLQKIAQPLFQYVCGC